MDVFQGKPHALSYDDIAFESMKKSYAQVLKTLFSIKKGQTITYSDLAMKSGLTKRHSRFVGSIMAKNPIPLIVPCHRVVKKSGELGNYSGSGGTATKKRLLTLEAR
ncbi:MAG: MGMT family protein [Methanobacteriota archaeon]|nr:MAG: MGMT family protein [Euryarchaeota archaeon]